MSVSSAAYPREMIGYGLNPPHAQWPNGAQIAVSFVLNYEEGGENCILHGDAASEAFLSEIIGAQPIVGARHMNMESIYEYGSRAGVWRLLRLFQEFNMPLTVYAVGMALERYPQLAEAFVGLGHEIASHGYRWIDYQNIAEEVEKADMLRSIETIKHLTGTRPRGWYLGRCSPNTRRLVAEEGGFLYDSDTYADDLPYWDHSHGRAQLMIPYTLDANDMRFATAQGFHTGDQFFAYLRDAFDALYAEGETSPKMMSVGLHCRLIGRPGRVIGLRRFLDHISRHTGVWVTRRIDIAQHWIATHPA
ncbi:allantoinase [Elstera litoralis]|uniref:Chitooligosaccharide deacetylase n=1 Tax=Elstera litoralis TaxID=552518 RepID=A0A0F3IU98_9PROT|nr:allantoinase PuuE [Elstera litoralis]KJV10325.1 allantoinase [Elstera litoralis]